MLDFLQVKWTEAKCGFLSLLPLLGGVPNKHMEKGGIFLSFLPAEHLSQEEWNSPGYFSVEK